MGIIDYSNNLAHPQHFQARRCLKLTLIDFINDCRASGCRYLRCVPGVAKVGGRRCLPIRASRMGPCRSYRTEGEIIYDPRNIAVMAETKPSSVAGPSPSSRSAARPARIRLQPRSGWQPVDLAALWHYRDLILILSLRDIKVRYKQTVLGIAWAIVQPVMSMVVFTVFFHGLAGVPSAQGIPYPIFAYAAMLPWQLFETSLTESSNSLVNNQNLITKVYFPRVSIPISVVCTALVDFCVAFTVLIGMMFYYRVTPGWGIAALPLFVLLALSLALGVGLWLSAMNVKYRDVRYTIPFLARIWFFATPVVYPIASVPIKWRLLYGVNPMVGVVEGFRWALLGKASAPGPMIWVSVLATLVLFVGGLFYFNRVERQFADLV